MSAAEPEVAPAPLRDVSATGAPQPAPVEEINLRELVVKLWRGKWLVVATAALLVTLVVTWMKLTDPLYTASAVIAPASEAGAGGLASRLSNLGGLASLAGIDLPAEEAVSPFMELMEIVTSPILAERLLENDPALLQKIFEEDWDAKSQSWVPPGGPVASVKGWIYGFFDQPAWTTPSATSLAKFLEEELDISDVEGTGMKRVAFNHKDPEFAVRFLKQVGRTSDGIIRQRSLERSSAEIAYIQEKLRSVTTSEHRLSLIELLSEQEKRMMMIQIDLPYAARVIEPARASEKPTFPKPPLFIAVAIVGGVLLGVFLVFLLDVLKRDVMP